MVKLKRKPIAWHPYWEGRVTKMLGANAQKFRQKAKQFERLKLHGSNRCSGSGFAKYAPDVLGVGKTGKAEFTPLWSRVKIVKQYLARMSRGHCAYCQSTVMASQAGAVEHFRPKNLFPTLAYSVNNYFLGCERCNAAKSDKWPKTGCYVRPDEGDPAERFIFRRDGTIAPRTGDNDATSTVADLNLNAAWLCDARKLLTKLAMKGLRRYLDNPSLSIYEKRVYANAALVPRLSPYSEAINQCLKRLWRQRYPGIPM